MKKLLTIVVVAFFSLTLFAQNSSFDLVKKKKTEIDQLTKRGMNHLLYNKKKELGKLKSKSQIQVPHPPVDDYEVLWTESYESGSGYYFLDYFFPASTEDNAEITKFNAYNSDAGGSSWWIGINDEDVLSRPGYGTYWAVEVYTDDYYFLQSDLDQRSVRFQTFYNIEEGYDACYLQIRTDAGGDWETLACYNGDTGSEWIEEEVDIPEDYNGEYVEFRFLFYSDGGADNDDGSFGSIGNPGGFFFDNFRLVRDDVAELLDDGDDNVQAFDYNLSLEFPTANTGAPFVITDDEASDGDSSLAIQEYPRPMDVAWMSGPIDLSIAGLGNNYAAPLLLDFDVLATGLPEPTGDPYVGWTPVVYVFGYGLTYPTGAGYVGDWDDDGDFITWSDQGSYIDLTDYYGYTIAIGFDFWVPQECGVDYAGEIYWDNLKLIRVNDPYEFNDYCDTASEIEYGFVSEFTNLFDASDVDWFHFEGEKGDWVDVYSISDDDLFLELYSGTDNETCVDWMMAGEACCPLWSYDDGAMYDRIIWRLPYTGDYFISVTAPAGDTTAYVMYLDRLENNAAITSITDVDGDQGKNVLIEFEAPELDNYEEVDFSKWGAHTVEFQIERKKNVIANEWDLVKQFDAFSYAPEGLAYRIEAATKYDSTSTYFRVKTKTGYLDKQGIFVTSSEQASGTSYDNIAPSFVAEYTLAPESGEGIDVGAEVDYGGGFSDSMTDIAFYNIYRSDASGFTPSAANKIATIETHNAEIRYNDVEYDGTVAYYYVIEVVDDGGNKAFSDEVNTITSVENEAVPTVYSLAQNYPNPFNPATTIKFGIPQAADVTIKIYDILGQEVTTLVNRNLAAGFHTVNFNASNLISGMYIYRIQANGVDGSNFTDVKKMLLVK